MSKKNQRMWPYREQRSLGQASRELFMRYLEGEDLSEVARYYVDSYVPPDSCDSVAAYKTALRQITKLSEQRRWEIYRGTFEGEVMEDNMEKLKERCGIKIDEADDVVQQILLNQDEGGRTRLAAADIIYKRLGAYKIGPEGKTLDADGILEDADKLLSRFRDGVGLAKVSTPEGDSIPVDDIVSSAEAM